MPLATRFTTKATVMRVPRMQARPPMTAGSNVMRSNMSPFPPPAPAMATPIRPSNIPLAPCSGKLGSGSLGVGLQRGKDATFSRKAAGSNGSRSSKPDFRRVERCASRTRGYEPQCQKTEIPLTPDSTLNAECGADYAARRSSTTGRCARPSTWSTTRASPLQRTAPSLGSLGRVANFTRYPSLFSPVTDPVASSQGSTIVRDAVTLPRFGYLIEFIYFPRPAGGIVGKKFELFMESPDLKDPVFVRFIVR